MDSMELFEKYFQRTMTPVEVEELKKILETEEGKRLFVRYADETGQIAHSVNQMEQVEAEDAVFCELVQRSEDNLRKRISGEPASSVKQVKAAKEHPVQQARKFPWLVVFAIATAFTVVSFFSREKPQTTEDEKIAEHVETPIELIKSVARVTSLDGRANVKLDQWLKPGAVKLESGEVELTFDSGAVVLLQGEAELNVESPMRAFLNSGKATARVPEEAKGFIVNTPQGTVVDLGTEFALSVDEDKAMEVHVLEGEVEADSVDGDDPKLLRKDDALRIDIQGEISERTSTRADQFTRVDDSLDPFNYNYVYWPFEERVRDLILDQGNMGFGGRFDLNLSSGGSISKGKYGNALSLSGRRKFATSNFRGIGGSNARTVSFWVRIPANSKRDEAYAIVAWGALGPSEKWQVAYNPNPNNGVVGAIRTEFAQGYIIGTTDLRDGRWHHIVSMFIGGEDADIATHIKHYVDGELEGVSGYVPRKVRTNISGPDSQPVYIGKYINHNKWYFRGKIDEFYIFDGALTPAEIRRLRDNSLINR